MQRRNFLKMLGVFGFTSIFPYKNKSFASTFPALPIPQLLQADANNRIRLKIQSGQCSWRKSPTQTWGINGPLLGPTLSLQRGQKVTMEVENTLPESTTLHWHGLEIPGIADGGPQAVIEPGKIWTPDLHIDQQAATCWYHPHPHKKSGMHVAMGLGGLLLIEDEDSRRLPLPKIWGEDDVPVILQDKRLDSADQIDYKMDVVNAAVGWFGNVLLTNGSIYPQHIAPRGWLRLRILNGCNARSLRLACSDNRDMYIIASDGGFLAEPVKITELPMYMGERFEVLVDIRDGKAFDLITLPVQQMGMTLPPFDQPLPALRIQPSQETRQTRLPDSLVKIPALPEFKDLPIRNLQLSMDPRLDQQGMQEFKQRYEKAVMAGMDMNKAETPSKTSSEMPDGSMNHGNMEGSTTSMHHPSVDAKQQPFDIWHSNFINNRAFSMDTSSFDVQSGQFERWVISGVGDMMLHPFHIHGTQFRILKENGAAPLLHRQGFKDTVRVEGEVSEVLVQFRHKAPKEHMYMAHCHLLEHEDTGMMLSFTVS